MFVDMDFFEALEPDEDDSDIEDFWQGIVFIIMLCFC